MHNTDAIKEEIMSIINRKNKSKISQKNYVEYAWFYCRYENKNQ